MEEVVAGLLFPQLLLLGQSRAVLARLSGQLTQTSSCATLTTRQEREQRLVDSLMSQCPNVPMMPSKFTEKELRDLFGCDHQGMYKNLME